VKNTIILASLLFSFSLATVSGQEEPVQNGNKPTKSSWSVSLSYSPHFTFSFDPSATYQPYKTFFTSFNVRVDRKPDSARVSVSSGFNARFKTIDYSNPSRTEKVTFLEFPVQVNYYIRKAVDKFDPYLRASLRICYFRSEFDHDRIPGELADNLISDYLPLLDIGAGCYIKINNRMDLLLESDIGYGLTNILPNRIYADVLAGIKFNL
jgi:hypothetical protein